MQLNEVANQILPYLRITKKTKYTYTRSYLRNFSKSIGTTCIDEVTQFHIREIISKLSSQSEYQAVTAAGAAPAAAFATGAATRASPEAPIAATATSAILRLIVFNMCFLSENVAKERIPFTAGVVWEYS